MSLSFKVSFDLSDFEDDEFYMIENNHLKKTNKTICKFLKQLKIKIFNLVI